MSFDDWFEERNLGLPSDYQGLNPVYLSGMKVGYKQGRLEGISNHDGRKLLIQFALDTDADMSSTTRTILTELLK